MSIQPASLQWRRLQLLVLATSLMTVIGYERLQGRLWWCACQSLDPISLHINSMHNSQHLLDAYSFSHLLHGVWFYGIFWFARRKLSYQWRLVAATMLESAWEMMENSSFIINRYRAGTASLGYSGDSIVNSLGDIGCCVAGFYLARLLGAWRSLGVIVSVELLMLWAIRDNLALNILMLLWPIDAVRRWQMGG